MAALFLIKGSATIIHAVVDNCLCVHADAAVAADSCVASGSRPSKQRGPRPSQRTNRRQVHQATSEDDAVTEMNDVSRLAAAWMH